MQLFKTTGGIVLSHNNDWFVFDEDWNHFINQDDLFVALQSLAAKSVAVPASEAMILITEKILAPIGTQEVWAAGVTYLRSRDARMEESESAGSADVYQKVYEAERPELFFKALPHRVAGPGQPVFIRRDSTWNVPEPELTLYINGNGNIQGYTIGNDMSSRSIEGENPLYLPQAKVYERSAALGPCLFVPSQPIDLATMIRMTIHRAGKIMFEDGAPLSRMKRSFTELAAWLYRACDFPGGCFLMTGTCVVPPPEFTLAELDVVTISIDGIGTLTNIVGIK